MGVRLLLVITILMASLNLKAQEKISFADLDAETYKLYENARWKELKKLGLRGLDQGLDYYYLRMRLGIAYYELKRYEAAREQFENALKFNDNDPVALEYLYYSLVLSGHSQEARLLANVMEKSDAADRGSLRGVFFEGGRVAAYLPDSLVAFKPVGPYVYHYLLKDYSYFSGGFNIITERLTLTPGINHMRFNAIQEGSIKDPSLPFAQYYSWDQENTQTGFYIGSEYIIKPRWYLGLSGHLITGKFNYMGFLGRQTMGADLFRNFTINYSDYVFTGDIRYRARYLLTVLTASFSDLGNQKRFQPGIGLTWYPLGNLNLYLQSQADRIMPLNGDNEHNWVLQGLAGTKIFSKLWLEAHAAAGRMEGWSEKSAYIVYNNQDPILLRGGANLIIPDIIPGLSITFRYQRQQREHSWEIYNGDALEGTETKKYLSNSLIGGISWNF